MKVGLQIVLSHKKPVLDFYYEVRNRFAPEEEYELQIGVEKGRTRTHKTRRQDIFIQFFVVNIGCIRAENVEFEVTGSLKRNKPREDLGELIKTEIPQMAPGQLVYLFRFDDSDLYVYPDEGGGSLGIKTDELQIVAKYNAPPSLLNWIVSMYKRLFGKKQYESKFVFRPTMVCGDLPPAEYA